LPRKKHEYFTWTPLNQNVKNICANNTKNANEFARLLLNALMALLSPYFVLLFLSILSHFHFNVPVAAFDIPGGKDRILK
jgi:hypothetical protein